MLPGRCVPDGAEAGGRCGVVLGLFEPFAGGVWFGLFGGMTTTGGGGGGVPHVGP